ncbi:MAG: aminoacyl-tRNA hydrolase [Firmicutes bacterium]|nr:aminoacyl-tRNA hydrolase [Bacillota bacterium]
MKTFLVVGLGNHGAAYANTWHNVGFIAVDRLCEELGFTFKKKPLVNYAIAEGSLNGCKVYLLKPYTYMNRSGEAVVAVMRKFKIPAENLVVIIDDLYIDKGKIRIGAGGSSGGGHNGTRSINEITGAKNYVKIKVGIKPEKEMHNQSSYVLARIPEDEKDIVSDSIDMASESVKMIIAGKTIADIQGKFNCKNKDKE